MADLWWDDASYAEYQGDPHGADMEAEFYGAAVEAVDECERRETDREISNKAERTHAPQG